MGTVLTILGVWLLANIAFVAIRFRVGLLDERHQLRESLPEGRHQLKELQVTEAYGKLRPCQERSK